MSEEVSFHQASSPTDFAEAARRRDVGFERDFSQAPDPAPAAIPANDMPTQSPPPRRAAHHPAAELPVGG